MAISYRPIGLQFTIDLRLLSGSARTLRLAGLALNIIFSPVNGLMPSRALVAGFFTTLSLSSPGSVNRPLPRRLFLTIPLRESNTSFTCLRESSVSLEIVARISDLVGAPPFFAIAESPRVWLSVREWNHGLRESGPQHSTS